MSAMRGSSGLGSFISICIEVSKVAIFKDGLHAPCTERKITWVSGGIMIQREVCFVGSYFAGRSYNFPQDFLGNIAEI